MDIIPTDSERRVLMTKYNNPELEVKCPRCGKNVIIIEHPTATEITCSDTKCIYTGIRGI